MSPARLFIYVWATWLLLAVSAPFIEYPFSKSPHAFSLLWVCNVAFLVPFFLLSRYIPTSTNNRSSTESLLPFKLHAEQQTLQLARLLCFVLGSLSLTLRLAVKLKTAGIGAGLNPIAIRAALLEEGASSGSLDIIAAVFYPFCLFYFVFNQLYVDQKGSPNPLITGSLFIMITLDSIMVGGVTGLALNYAYIWFSSKQAYSKISAKLITLCAAILLIAGYLFYLRVESMYDGVSIYLTVKDGSWLMHLDPAIYDLVSNEGLVGYLCFVTFYISYYFTHGVYEFYYLVDKFDTMNFAYGQLQFGVILKALNFIGFNFEDYTSLQSRINIIVGHYQTFWGNAYMDFGYGAILEATILGFAALLFYIKRIQGTIGGHISYPLIQSLIIYSIFANGLSGERFYIVAIAPVATLAYLGIRSLVYHKMNLQSSK